MQQDIVDDLQGRVDEVLDEGRKMIDEEKLVDRIDDVKQTSEGLIRRHPIKSVASAVFAGYILGKIFSAD